MVLRSRRLDADAGVVDEDVDAAGRLGDPRDDRVDRGAVGDIEREGEMRLTNGGARPAASAAAPAIAESV